MTQGKGGPIKDFGQLREHFQGPGGRQAGTSEPPQPPVRPPPAGGLPYRPGLNGGYFDPAGYIRAEFIVEYAKDIADKLEAGGMTRSLLRNFYSEVMDTKNLLLGGRPFESLRPRVLKLEAFASNAANRRTSPAPLLFQRFIDENVRVASQDSHSFLDGFCQHFECVVLFFRGR